MTIEKRNKFRSQKNALKEEKEGRQIGSGSSNDLSSNSSSLNSSPSQTPTPTSPLSSSPSNMSLSTSNDGNAVKCLTKLNILPNQAQIITAPIKTTERVIHISLNQSKPSNIYLHLSRFIWRLCMKKSLTMIIMKMKNH